MSLSSFMPCTVLRKLQSRPLTELTQSDATYIEERADVPLSTPSEIISAHIEETRTKPPLIVSRVVYCIRLY